MSVVYNFCAGPAMLPTKVMSKAQQEFINWQNTGCSVMELSHRSKEFMALAAKAEADLRQLMNIPVNYRVLFCHGGGRGQFSAIPLNLLPENGHAEYIVSGSWSKAAAKEAQNFGNIRQQNVVDELNGRKVVKPFEQWQVSPDAAYLHYCPNETVDGIEMFDIPKFGDVPIVADMSSTILSHDIDVNKFALIYAGAQKNIGPSGLTIVIVREDLLGNARINTPCILNYTTSAENDSMYNTPPTYAWYLAGLVFEWLKSVGGVSAIENVNKRKAKLIYDYVDNSTFYKNTIDPEFRSRMNVPFWLADESLNDKFLSEAKEQGLVALKGHRLVGGMRASIYNAMPIEGVEKLIEFMQSFEERNQ
ncbi:3-phosphoserine/phosphohydroxythreonine transaminase [Thalassotalea sediminis]|uniref:3-phosphoserine/phosphohydroxythreonine transaminase n=1 Tax=Thalassotalea sediminis TaxID=1759089 RepID=UPI002572363C|nr:3-phosphoserine/phosphohydroxythreonine transaminase [Thalassotalea sediminis]